MAEVRKVARPHRLHVPKPKEKPAKVRKPSVRQCDKYVWRVKVHPMADEYGQCKLPHGHEGKCEQRGSLADYLTKKKLEPLEFITNDQLPKPPELSMHIDPWLGSNIVFSKEMLQDSLDLSNHITMRIEQRMAQQIHVPQSFIKGSVNLW